MIFIGLNISCNGGLSNKIIRIKEVRGREDMKELRDGTEESTKDVERRVA